MENCKLTEFEMHLLNNCSEVTNNLPIYSPETDYQLALQRELTMLGYEVMTEVVCTRQYKNKPLDHGKNDRLDLVVLIDGKNIILELKSADCIKDRHRIQLVNYLSQDKESPGYLINFQEKDGNVQIEKLIYKNEPILKTWSLEKNPETQFQFGKNDILTKEFSKSDLLKICKLASILPTAQSRPLLINMIKEKLNSE
mgnify:CR=1 FL=1